MSENATGNKRHDSLSRKAFSAAADGHQTEIAVEVYPTTQYPTSLSKVGRCLLPDGDMNAPWQLLDEILAVNGEEVLRILCEGIGYEVPKRRSLDVPSAIRELTTQMEEMKRALVSIGQQQRELAKVRRAPEMPARKATA